MLVPCDGVVFDGSESEWPDEDFWAEEVLES